MDYKEKKYLRSILFRHLDGIVIVPTIATLANKGICEYILKNNEFSLEEINTYFNTNKGYLNVALRLLASQGWIDRKFNSDNEQINFLLTSKGHALVQKSHIYQSFNKYTQDLIIIDETIYRNNNSENQSKFINIINELIQFLEQNNQVNSTDWELVKHIEGFITGPILVSLKMSHFFNDSTSKSEIIDTDTYKNFPVINNIIKLFVELNWLNNNKFTNEGLFYLRRASAYGVTVSYLPTFEKLNELLYGDPNILWERTEQNHETHVNRTMNVWGSGGAHTIYFKKIDEIIIDIFNEDINKQPIGIADMGCGDGTLLIHLYNVVKSKTIRGQHLDKHPLKIVGADYNKAALISSKINLSNADINHIVIHGDISNPSSFADILEKDYKLDLKNMLNVRSFLDHNRIYREPLKKDNLTSCNSTGAFAYRGSYIPNSMLKQNLIEHFTDWEKYVKKYGLLILELHTIAPETISANLGCTAVTAYDATHGYSDQYIVEVGVLIDAAKSAGLRTVQKYQALFPSKEIPNISINLLRS